MQFSDIYERNDGVEVRDEVTLNDQSIIYKSCQFRISANWDHVQFSDVREKHDGVDIDWPKMQELSIEEFSQLRRNTIFGHP